jgi:hypothetical protein
VSHRHEERAAVFSSQKDKVSKKVNEISEQKEFFMNQGMKTIVSDGDEGLMRVECGIEV